MDTIVILGNCQAQMLEGIFSAGCPDFCISKMRPIFEMAKSDYDSVFSNLLQAKFIFSQRVSDDYYIEWLRPNILRKNFPRKVIIWPNIYFDGYFPDAQYIYHQHRGKLQGPLDDYHLMRIFNAFKAGLTEEQATELFFNDVFGADSGSFERSLQNLIKREADVDVRISHLLASLVIKTKIFYTPNHPTTEILCQMAQLITDAASIKFDKSAAIQFNYHLNKVVIPVYPTVARAERLQFNDDLKFTGLDMIDITDSEVILGNTQSFNWLDIVRQFYILYRRVYRSI